MSPKQLAEHGDFRCWYVDIPSGSKHIFALNIYAICPFQYSLDSLHLDMNSGKN